MNKRKGFTLVELLVVMVILGIVIGLSFPAIRVLQEKNTDRKYNSYKDSLKSSAKLYVDSYDEDLFGRKESGCACIKYEELESKKLTKDITVKDVTCDTDNTFVRVNKVAGAYTYDSFIGCKEKNESKVSIIYPKQDKPHTMAAAGCDTMCNDEVTNGIYVYAYPSSSTEYAKKHYSTVRIKSITGINQGAEIYYAWSKNSDNSESLSNYKRVRITVPANQKEIMENEWNYDHSVTATSTKIYTPVGKSGSYYLHVRVDRLYDLYDSLWKQGDGGKYLVFGPFNIDNEPPTIERYEFVSKSEDYNSEKPDLIVNASDNVTASDELKYCLSTTVNGKFYYNTATINDTYSSATGANYCSPKSYTDYTRYRLYYYINLKNPISMKYMTPYNNKYDFYMTIVDKVGNITELNGSYTTANQFTLTYDSNGGRNCSPISKSVIVKRDGTSTWGYLCTPTRDYYSFVGWYTDKTSGTVITKDSPVDMNRTVYAHWSGNIYKVTLSKEGGKDGTDEIYEKYKSGWFSDSGATTSTSKVTIPQRDGYSFGGYYAKKSGKGDLIINSGGQIVASNDKFTANSTIYALWTPKVLTITLDKQGAVTDGTVGPIYLKYNTGWYSKSDTSSALTKITTPTKEYDDAYATDYYFQGYFTGTGGSGTKIIDRDGKPLVSAEALQSYTSSGTAYAYWIGDGWQLTNSLTPIGDQKWVYWIHGVEATGWQHLCPTNNPCETKSWWYFDPTTKYALVKWHKIDGQVYYFEEGDPDGNGKLNADMFEGGYKKFPGGWAYFDKNGHCIKGVVDGYDYQYCGGY